MHVMLCSKVWDRDIIDPFKWGSIDQCFKDGKGSVHVLLCSKV